MEKQQYKWIKVETKDVFRLPVAQVDVSHLSKKGIEQEWDRLESKFPNHLSSLNTQKRDFSPRFFENN